MGRCLCSRSASAAQDEDVASVTSNSAVPGGISEYEREKYVANVDADVQKKTQNLAGI